jgi:hypothetical protein
VPRAGGHFRNQEYATWFLRLYYRKNMATATCFPGDPTPALIEFSLLESWLASSRALQLPLHQIESRQQAKGREVQRLLLQAHWQHRGNGDVGPALQLEQADGGALYSRRRLSARSLTTVFGTVALVRMGYSRPSRPSIFPLDQALALPARPFSYELQRRLVKCRRPEPVSGIGANHCRVDRRFRLQTQSGRNPSGCRSGL